MSEAFTFRGHVYTLTESEQKVTVKGPWMPNARKLFTRRCRSKNTASPTDETAADMLVRVEFDAAKYEVRFAAHLSALRAQARSYPPLFARRETMLSRLLPPHTQRRTPHRRASARCDRMASRASRRPSRWRRGKRRLVRSGHSLRRLLGRELRHEERANSMPLARCTHRTCDRLRRARMPAVRDERSALASGSIQHR